MLDQIIVFAVLLGALILFVWGKPRYDVVAILALLALVVLGVTPANNAFDGFGHAAVITVAMILILSVGLIKAGIVDIIVTWLERLGDSMMVQLGALLGIVTVASAFMNNVGALALVMPVAIRLAYRTDRSPSIYLMPLAFGSLLGGITTLIGTPPNIIISGFRERAIGEPFAMFDFFPAGSVIALVGLLFILFLGWRLTPKRQPGRSNSMFKIEDYLTEVRVPPGSRYVGRPLDAVEAFHETDAVPLGLARTGGEMHMPAPQEELREDDVLLIQADSDTLDAFLQKSKFVLVGCEKHCMLIVEDVDSLHAPEHQVPDTMKNQLRMELHEAVVKQDSRMVGRNVRDLQLRTRFGVNLVAVARQGERTPSLLKEAKFKPGDVLLLQGATETVADSMTRLGCLPLPSRSLQLGEPRKAVLAGLIFLGAIALTSFEVLSVQVSMTMAVVAMLFTRILSVRDLYISVEWPVIVLLGAMMPLGIALESTGAAAMIASNMVSLGEGMSPAFTVGLLFVLALILTNLINNAAAAMLMGPIAISMAQTMHVSPDPLLMATCIACSSPFLTPIGHQSCTLVMGPGGYRFSDYWRSGLPLSIVVTVVALISVLWFWPL